MAAKLTRGDKVYVLVGDESGAYGVVVLVSDDEYHIGMHALNPETATDVRVFSRDELRKPRG
jgi:ribosomal protein L24